MDDVVVIGVGMHAFGQHPDLSVGELGRSAIWAALHDAGVDARLIDIIYVANCYHGFFTGQGDGVAPVIAGYAGLSGMPMVHVSGGSASASLAFHQAALAVGSGEYRLALAVGAEKQYVPGDPARSISAVGTSGERTVAIDMGLTWIGELTMGARQAMRRYGWSAEHFAAVAEKNRYHASLNPLAATRTTTSVADVLASRMVAAPLTRDMCAAAAIDGSAAALVCTRATAREFGIEDAPRVAAFVARSTPYRSVDQIATRPEMTSMNDVPEVFAELYRRSGVGPEDLELLQVHDAITPEELLAYQVVGLCEPGEEPALLRSGATRLGGAIPTNTDGGLLARGHPIGATGLAQIYETVVQMRGQAGDRQVWSRPGRPPAVAAIQNVGARGGPAFGGVAACLGLILTR